MKTSRKNSVPFLGIRQRGRLFACLCAALLLSSVACSDDSSAPALDSAALDVAPQLLDGEPQADAANDLAAEGIDLAGDTLLPQPDQFLGEAVPRPDVYVQTAPSLANVTLLVNLGDSIAAGYGVPPGASYRELLVKNDDQAYPDYAGEDLEHLYPGIGYADLSWPGATSDDIPTQLANAPANPAGETLVLISVGGNDLLFNYSAALDPAQARAMAQGVVAQIQDVATHFADTSLYPGGATLVLLNVYDPTDGMGTFPDDAPVVGTCADAAPYLDLVGDVLMQSLAAYNEEIATYVMSSEVLLADIHSLFLGHGFQHDNPASLFYVADDHALWFALDCIHPNIPGHEAIRRLLWHILFEGL